MDNSVKILMVDDDEEDFLIVRNLLAQSGENRFSIEWAASFDTGMEVMRQRRHDIYLVDYRLGADNGLDLIRHVLDGGHDSPFILLTGTDDPMLDKEAELAGASDFLVKGDFTAKELIRTIRYAIAHAQDLAEIKELNAGLEKRVAERTQELENAKLALEIALSQEKELNGMKSRFVSMASHEFRTPLTAIASSAALIEAYMDRQDAANVIKHTGRINRSVENLNTILGEFLSLGKLEEGKMQANFKELNLREAVEDVSQEMKHLFKNGQVFNFQHTGEETVLLDGGLLKNVLINLISNAIKYSSEGAGIHVRSEANGETVSIEVQDEGIGISETDQQKLFGRFFRAENVGAAQGTGLGLYIVKRYVEMMNGTISFESKLGEGSKFLVVFNTDVTHLVP